MLKGTQRFDSYGPSFCPRRCWGRVIWLSVLCCCDAVDGHVQVYYQAVAHGVEGVGVGGFGRAGMVQATNVHSPVVTMYS